DTIPGMWNRTITIGSAGKSFAVTGHNIGYAYGPEHLIKPLKLLHEYSISKCSKPLQEAIAIAYEQEYELLNQPSSFLKQYATSLETKRDLIANMLSEVQMNAVIPEGGYYVTVDIRKIAKLVNITSEKGETKDTKFVNWLSKTQKLQGIPLSVFFSTKHHHISKNFIRLCFAKRNETFEGLRQTIDGLKKYLNE
ncbi:Kynurenine--oxoglutarate transaminase 3-like protein, partial [Leptotrombidium deliense]